jgi:single-strand DNA-binding protein
MTNNITILGRLVREPELSATQTGKKLCKITIANDTGYGDRKKTNFIDVRLWEKSAEIANQYARKGSLVAITGQLIQDRWQDKTSGQNRTEYHVQANEIQLLDKRDGKAEPEQQAWTTTESSDDEMPF